MATTEKPETLTVHVNGAVARALHTLAAERHRPVDEIIDEALRDWLARAEESADLAAIAEAQGEETTPWEQVRAEMRAARADARAE